MAHQSLAFTASVAVIVASAAARLGCATFRPRYAEPIRSRWWIRVSVALVTGSAGLIGSEAVRHFAGLGLDVVGIDNDMRQLLLRRRGVHRLEPAAAHQRARRRVHPPRRRHPRPRRPRPGSSSSTARTSRVVIHTAAPAEPRLGRARSRSPTSTSTPSARSTCWRTPACTRPRRRSSTARPTRCTATGQPPAAGRAGDPVRDRARPPVRAAASPRTCRSTHCLHSVFGASKVAADVMVQEYGRYFGMKTAVLPRRHADRPGALGDRAARLPRLPDALRHGGPHVQALRLQGQDGPRRDPLARRAHRVRGVLPRPALGEVYNLGGGRHSNTSHLEAFALAERDHRPARR